MKLDLSKVPDKTEDEAWALLTQASEERDIGDFKEAVQILSKVNPTLTYPELEKEFRNRDFNVYLIAMVCIATRKICVQLLTLRKGKGPWRYAHCRQLARSNRQEIRGWILLF